MKKYWLSFFALVLVSSFVMAKDNIGITTGLGYGISGINKPDGRTPVNGLKASISYGNAFLNKMLNVYAETEYDIAFVDPMPMGLNFEFKLGYSLRLSVNSGLTFIVQDENYLKLSPPQPNNLWGAVRPGIRYTYRTKIGTFYGQVDIPITYSNDDYDSMIYLDTFIRWRSTFGLGIDVKVGNYIYGSDWLEKGYQVTNITVSYGYKLVYAQVEVEIPKDLDSGIIIIPKVEVSIPAVPSLRAYLECNLTRVGNDYNRDMVVSPILGVTYSF